MAGTYVDGEKKIRPGTYFLRKKKDEEQATIIDGVVALLLRADSGPLNEVVEITNEEDYSSIYVGEKTDCIQEVFHGGAKRVLCCRVGTGGAASELSIKNENDVACVIVKTKYPSKQEYTMTIKDKLVDNTKKQCIIYSGTTELEKVEIDKGGDEAEKLVAAFSHSLKFIAEKKAAGVLQTLNQERFTVGESPTVTVEDYATGFSVLEPYFANVVCVDTEDASVHRLLAEFLKRIYHAGQLSIGIVAELQNKEVEERINTASSYNSESMVYLLNARVMTVNGELNGYQTAARIAGMIAACPSNQSLTHTIIRDFTELNENLTNTIITKAEAMGCMVLAYNTKRQIFIDNAINTLNHMDEELDEGWKKIRRTKTRYELIRRMNEVTDALNGKVDNDNNGRAAIIAQLQDVGTLMVEESKLMSCTVAENEEKKADGDSAWFIVDVVDKDSAEHIYLNYLFQFSTNV